MSGLTYKLKKMRKMPLNVIFVKIASKLMIPIQSLVRRNIPINLKDQYFQDFYPSCNFVFDSDNKEFYVSKLKILGLEREIIQDADRICEHIFDVLGSGESHLGEKLHWNQDFKSGFIWENKYYKQIKIIDLNNNADVKIPWELSRFQHLLTLGKAYWLTNNEKYAVEFMEEVKDWIEQNPIEMSVNWTCTMDVAIRAVNWIVCYNFFKSSTSISKMFWINFDKTLYLHGRFIIKNLENHNNITGNHYLSNIIGLIWLGIYYGGCNVNDRQADNNPNNWLTFGLNELQKEIFVQTNEDGTNYEASTSYHRLVTEMFLITTVMCNKNNINFLAEYVNRLEKMCEFIMNLTKPNGLSPLIGDADDGRLVIFSNYSSWVRNDFRHLLAIAGEYFNRNDFRYIGRVFQEDALWAIGDYKEVDDDPIKLVSTAYKDGGYFFLRNDRIYCCIRCGELSFRGRGTHSHNDQLSFELNVDGEDVIVDPGAYVYTADYKKRNLFRSTEMHNTIQIERFEQNKIEQFQLFLMEEETFGKCEKFGENVFVGHHDGYVKKCGTIHRREIKLSKNNLEITDWLIGDSVHNFKNRLFLEPEINVAIQKENIEIHAGKTKIKIRIEPLSLLRVGESQISRKYGCLETSRYLETESRAKTQKNTFSF